VISSKKLLCHWWLIEEGGGGGGVELVDLVVDGGGDFVEGEVLFQGLADEGRAADHVDGQALVFELVGRLFPLELMGVALPDQAEEGIRVAVKLISRGAKRGQAGLSSPARVYTFMRTRSPELRFNCFWG
jgi:hypothetical protein